MNSCIHGDRSRRTSRASVLIRQTPLKDAGIYASANSGATAETVPEEYRSSFINMEQNADAPVMDIEAIERIRGRDVL